MEDRARLGVILVRGRVAEFTRSSLGKWLQNVTQRFVLQL